MSIIGNNIIHIVCLHCVYEEEIRNPYRYLILRKIVFYGFMHVFSTENIETKTHGWSLHISNVCIDLNFYVSNKLVDLIVFVYNNGAVIS